MEVIFVSKSSKHCGRWHCGSGTLFGIFALIVLMVASLAYLTLKMGVEVSANTAINVESEHLYNRLEQQKVSIARAKNEAQLNLDALAKRIADLQARVIRLDALGERLVDISELDPLEFDFTQQHPGSGGIEQLSQSSNSVPDFLENLIEVEKRINDREEKLDILGDLMSGQRIEKSAIPQGRPVTKGWISSYYGKRTDPVNGKKSFHDGLDFAGKSGTDVYAVAAGIVTWSGKRHGYGNVVEITHGNGYVTRYAHNKKNLVEVAERIEKGQIIALMGSSGRSTGPHVHFEVIRNGKQVNPLRFVKASIK